MAAANVASEARKRLPKKKSTDSGKFSPRGAPAGSGSRARLTKHRALSALRIKGLVDRVTRSESLLKRCLSYVVREMHFQKLIKECSRDPRPRKPVSFEKHLLDLLDQRSGRDSMRGVLCRSHERCKTACKSPLITAGDPEPPICCRLDGVKVSQHPEALAIRRDKINGLKPPKGDPSWHQSIESSRPAELMEYFVKCNQESKFTVIEQVDINVDVSGSLLISTDVKEEKLKL